MTEKTQCLGKPGLLPKGALFNELHGISPQLLPLNFVFTIWPRSLLSTLSSPCFQNICVSGHNMLREITFYLYQFTSSSVLYLVPLCPFLNEKFLEKRPGLFHYPSALPGKLACAKNYLINILESNFLISSKIIRRTERG